MSERTKKDSSEKWANIKCNSMLPSLTLKLCSKRAYMILPIPNEGSEMNKQY